MYMETNILGSCIFTNIMYFKNISNNTVPAVIAYSALSDTVRAQKLRDIF